MGYKKLLLVEGPDDSHVFFHLLQRHQIQVMTHEKARGVANGDSIVIQQTEGSPNLLDNLRLRLKPTDEDIELAHLAVVVDADTVIGARWVSIRDILIQAGYKDVPPQPRSAGVIVERDGPPKVGVWLMPDNEYPGELENFLALLVPNPGQNLWLRAKDCVDHISAEERLFSVEDTSKVYIHTWLAWQKEPGVRMGAAIHRGYFDANAEYAQRFVSWISLVFE